MVSLAGKIDDDTLGDLPEDSEPQSWWRCCPCCPKKETEKAPKARSRRKSVQMAEETLESLDIETDSGHKIEAKYLPLTFIPDFIIYEIFESSFRSVPYVLPSNVVLLMADVCGFTSLCESYCQKGVSGIEELASVLNGFMSTLSAMLLEGGGDILNFAGDAFLVQWIEEGKYKGMQKAVKKAYECAVALQTHRCLMTKNLDGTLKVKIGIAMGEISTWILGSSEFLLFVAAGPTLPSVQKAEDLCNPGDIVVSGDVYKVLKEVKVNTYTTTELKNGYVKIRECAIPDSEDEPTPNRIEFFEKCTSEHIAMSKIFLIPALRGLQSADELQYVSELTMVTILFICLLNIEVAEPKVLDSTFDIILESVKKFGGVLNKMLLFDKGCTFLLAFGLPGLKHSNDAARGINCAEDIVDHLNEIDIQVSIGISSGTCFCGIVGHPQRQEYTGSHVNMAARIMVVYNDQPIALNVDTYHLSRDELGEQNFVELPARKMKGIDSAGAVYAYRKQLVSKRKSTSTFEFVEDSNLHGSVKLKEKIKYCVKAMCDKEQRKGMKEKTLLPVLIIKGHSSSGKSYLMFFTVDTAVAIGCKFAVCCCLPTYSNQPFFVVSQLIRRMLAITMNESCIDRENVLMSFLPNSECHDFYLLNHLFAVQFTVPEDVAASIDYRNEMISKLCKMIIRKFAKNKNTLIAVDNAEYMDDQSWYIIHELSEEDRILVVLSLSLDFKEINVSASALLLKAFLHINMESAEQDFFAPLLCWFLGVKAVHTGLFVYLKEITHGKIQLLKEISLSPTTTPYIDIVPLESLDPERIKKEFYMDQFEVLNDDEDWACDLKPGIDLREARIPTNINDAVKESLNNLTIQDRLLLKRAAVLGLDFDLHALESLSAGMKRSEVLQCISNLLSKHIFSSMCTLENMIDKVSTKVPSVTLNCRNTCFCFPVYLRTQLKHLKALEWLIGPYHRLKFRTQDFRSCILAYMTKDQLYSMRMEVADNLEKSGPECAACKSRRIEGMDLEAGTSRRARSYSIDITTCTCLDERPKIYSEISTLYASIGMIFLPPYFMRKAAQAKNSINFPVQALHFLQIAEEMMPQYWMMSEEETWEAESYFDPVILDISLKKTKAESFLLLGDTYHAATNAFQALEMLGMDAVCFHGVFNPKEFKRILPKYRLLHAESITKLVGVLAKAYLRARAYKLAEKLLRIEYVALASYPIDFLHVLNHMTSMYQLKYFIHETEKLQELQQNIFKLCHEKLLNFEILMDLTEINGIGASYVVIIEVNLALAQLDKSENTASEAISILQLASGRYVLPKIRILLAHVYFHKKDYLNCIHVITDLGEMPATIANRIFRSLYISTLSMFLRKSIEGIHKTEIPVTYDKCNAFATSWTMKSAEVMPKDIAFYVSICLARWCLYADKNTMFIAAKNVFNHCYEIADHFHKIIDKSKHNYWIISAILLRLKLQVSSLKEDIDGVSADQHSIQEELNSLQQKIIHYPIHMATYKKLVDAVQDIAKK